MGAIAVVRAMLAVVAGAVIAGCGGADADDAPARQTRVIARVAPAAALVPLPGGGLLAGERATGRILAVDATGRTRVAYPRIAVSTTGQRGLLGLALVRRRVFAAWTTPRGRLVVGELRRGAAPVLRWRGPRSATLANGGHLAASPAGRLTVGVGDLQRGGQRGRLLSLDPDGPATQRAQVLSTGWNNPFAFAYTSDGALWVADNAAGRRPERLARGDRGRPRAVTALPVKTAPSGVAALPDGALAVCGFASGALDRYVRAGGGWRRAGVIARGCRYGVVVLGDGRIVLSGDRGLREVRG